MCITTWTTPEDKVWKVWSDIGQEEGHMVGFTSYEEFEMYEHEYNVKTYGENYEELFEQYEIEAEEYVGETLKQEDVSEDKSSNQEMDKCLLEGLEQQPIEQSNEPRWLSEEEARQAGIKWNGVDLDSPEEREKCRLMFEEMEEETNFINNLKVQTTLDDGTILETEFKQLEKIC